YRFGAVQPGRLMEQFYQYTWKDGTMINWYDSNTFTNQLYLLTANALYETALQGGDDGRLPEHVTNWLSRLRLLYGVPFEYLVPDERLLPKESIRFFYIDRNWTDRMLDGALSVGKTSSREHAHHHAVKDLVVEEVDNEERKIRYKLRNAAAPNLSGGGKTLTGFLLRSRAVSGWPGLEVTATDANDGSLNLLRMDRLAPSLLLCIFDDIPDSVIIEEPREGIQFGVDPNQDENGFSYTELFKSGYKLKLRHITGDQAGREIEGKDPIDMPVRAANPRVLHISKLKEKLESELPDVINSAGLAVQMLQFPYKQEFHGDGREDPDLRFPTVPASTIYDRATVNIFATVGTFSNEELTIMFPNVVIEGEE
ncbi:MAG: hypothetical protein O7C75_06325, partial [Verrucomicrobia bacterium]|nr:hypothetical protein [Verrucomicrobiota bacterium]